MPTFGSYETAQRLFLSGVGGIYALKSDDKKVIKVLHPPVGIWLDDRIQEEIDAFRLRAKIQKGLAKSSRFWAPIHDSAAIRDSAKSAEETGGSRLDSAGGELEGRPVADGAFAVMDRYERSVQSLIDGRVNIQNADLRPIFSAVIQGLLDLRKTSDRPHGALKASNILLANSADLATATIHLTDPAPDGALTANTAAKDLSDMGRILYHLVNRRAYDEGTIGRNPAWDALGPNGEDWRKLCNSLLDTHAPADERDLEKILPRIATWTAKPRRSKKPMALAMVALVLIAGGIVGYIQLRPKPVKFDALDWQNEALAYRAWFEDFAAEVQRPSNRGKFNGGPATRPGDPPFPILAPLFDKDHDYNPVSISKRTGERDIDWEDLIANPNQFVINPPGPKSTLDGNTQIQQVTEALAKWSVMMKIEDAAKRYKDLGWGKPAAGLQEVSQNARPPVIPPPARTDQPNADIHERYKIANEFRTQRKLSIIEGMTQAVAAARSVDNIDRHWQSITDHLATLHTDTGNVPLLKKLPEFARSIPHSEPRPDDPGSVKDLNDLDASFTKVEALLTTLSAALSSSQEVVYTELARDPVVGEDVAPSIAAFEALATAVPNYVKLKSDPRDKVLADWNAGQVTLASDMDDYLTKAAGARVEGIQAKLDQLKARRTALESALAEAAKTVAIMKNSAAISASATDAAGKITQIFKDAQDWSAPFKTDPVQYVKEKHDYLLTAKLATPSVDTQWKAAHNQYLAKVEATKENLRKDYNYRLSVDDKFKRIEDAYKSIEAAIPDAVPGLSEVAGTDWRHTIAARVATVYREDALKDLLSNLPVSEDVPNIEDGAFVSFRTQRLAGYEKTRADTLALLKDYAALNGQLDQLQLLPEEPSAGNSWSDLYKKWGGAPSQNPLLTDASISAALKPISDRVKALLDLNQVADYKTLLAQAQAPAPEIALAAWRKLGTAPLTEDIPALDDEDKAEAAVKAHLAALPLDAGRAQKLTAEIDTARPKRWHRWADGVVAGDNIAHAVGLAKSFGVEITRQAEPTWFYYQQLLNLRSTYQANAASEDALKGPANDFIKAVTDPPLGDLPNDAAVKNLLEEMKKSLSKEQDTSSASKQGPQWANWKMDAPNDQIRLFHSADGKFNLEFQMMSVSEANSQKTIYLCTTEMSVGLFMDCMNTLGKIDEVDNKKHRDAKQDPHWFEIPANKSDDTFYELGVRSWRISNGKFDLNSKWIDEDGKGFPAQMTGKSVYPENARPQPPTADNPIQLLSPWSAMYAAQLLGCRIPTTAEWKAAYAQFEAKDGLPKNVWNLRGEGGAGGGASWRSQQEYAKVHALDNLNFPDKNIFLEDIFYKLQGKDSVPWTSDALAKIAPNRITPGAAGYANSTLWFLPVDKEIIPAASAGAPKLTMHHLVGNVAEYTFDGETATAVVASNKPDPLAINKTVQAGRNKMYVIGASSLSAPDNPFNKEQPVDVSDSATKIGFSDVGFRLAYTAPKDSIVQVLERNFRDSKVLPGPRKK